jgi:DNA transformation protein
MNKDQSDLITLKNIGRATVNILHAVGINSYEDLKNEGPVKVYLSIQRRNINVSKVMLYALQGALLNTHWTQLDPELKQQLLSDANNATPKTIKPSIK